MSITLFLTSRRYKGEKQNDFAGVDADKLKLWKAISKTKTNSKHFPDSPTEECIYVLVEALVSTATSSREQELLDELTSSKALLNKSVYARNGRRTVNIEHPALENDGAVLNMLNDSGKYSPRIDQDLRECFSCSYQLYGLGESDDHSLSVFPPFTCEHKELKDDYSQAILKHLIAELEARLKSISISGNEASK
ncbi:hypothetical protein RhiirB3_445341 [Rhizophagus irregularis]|nr:hypothetical protein RhiirB3_445341 [Rhizophagus irregularis]